jgi:hypothetical protein
MRLGVATLSCAAPLAIEWSRIMPPHDIFAGLRTSPDDAEPFLTRVRKVVVDHAVDDGNLVDEAIGETIWAQIRWSRSLGWPIGNRMADGFCVRFLYGEVGSPPVGQDGTVDPDNKWKCGPTPLLWDGPHDEENFRVGIMAHMHHNTRHWRYYPFVDFKPGVKWQGTNPWWLPPARRIRYPTVGLAGDGTFKPATVGPTFLEDFLVDNAHY